MTEELNSKFVFYSEDGIIKPEHLGISGNRALIGVPFSYVTTLSSLQAPPYANTGFKSEVKIGGESVKCSAYIWLINTIERKGRAKNFEVESLTVIPPDKSAVIEKIKVKNTSDKDLDIPLELWYGGCPEYVQDWVFSEPDVTKKEADGEEFTGKRLNLKNSDGSALIITSSVDTEYFALAKILKTRVRIQADTEQCYYFSFHQGENDVADSESAEIAANYEEYIASAFEWVKSEENRLLGALPKFSCENELYEKFYYRSLVTLLLNRWEIPQFKLNPYYSTGGTTGGCMCSYLWATQARGIFTRSLIKK